MKELGLAQPLISWHTVRDTIAEVGAFLGLVGGSLGKIAMDVKLMMQTEVAEVFEPFAPGRGSSSTMPQKRNPISCLYIHANISVARQHSAALMDAMVADHERSTGPWEIEWVSLPEIFCLMSGALKQTKFVLTGLEVDADRMRANIDLTHGLVMSEAVMMGLGPYHRSRVRARPRLRSLPPGDRRTAAADRDPGRAPRDHEARRPQATRRDGRARQSPRPGRSHGRPGAGGASLTFESLRFDPVLTTSRLGAATGWTKNSPSEGGGVVAHAMFGSTPGTFCQCGDPALGHGPRPDQRVDPHWRAPAREPNCVREESLRKRRSGTAHAHSGAGVSALRYPAGRGPSNRRWRARQRHAALQNDGHRRPV